LSVRKRVIKLLKQFYGVTEDNARKVDISTRLILRNSDEDDTVKDLATKTIEEIWFPPVSLPSALKNRGLTMANSSDKTTLLSKVVVIMGTAANFKDRQSPLEDILHKIMVDKEGQEAITLHARYGEICEALIDGLVDATDLPGFVRTIFAPSVRSNHFLDCYQLHPNHLSPDFGVPRCPYWSPRLNVVTVPQEREYSRGARDVRLSSQDIPRYHSSYA